MADPIKPLTREELGDWIGRYEEAWRAAGTQALAGLFTTDATYSAGPYEQPLSGLDAIEAMWEQEREGPDEVFAIRREIVAVEDGVGVARLEVDYGDPVVQSYRDLWIVTLRPDGRCTSFEEWPFWPPDSKGGRPAAT